MESALTLIDIQIDEAVLIEDGYVTIFLPRYDITIKQRVKQIKGRGTSDAIELKGKRISEKYHRPLLEMLLWPTSDRIWKSEDICNKLRINFHLKDPKYKFIENNWRRPISEFLKLGILTHPQGNAQLYKLDVATAKKVLETGTFE